MACISPIKIKISNAWETVPCGKCNSCLSLKRCDWTFRLYQELRRAKSAYFITLTYHEEHQPTTVLPEYPETKIGILDKEDLKTFFKALKQYDRRTAKPVKELSNETIRYYGVGEYGSETFRPHYHGIVFNLKPETVTRLNKIWSKGFSSVGSVEPASIHYVTKYVLSNADKSIYTRAGITPPFSLISKGVGRNYLDTNARHHQTTLQGFVYGTRGKQRLPRYYSDKIFGIKSKELIKRTNVTENDLLYRKTIIELSENNPDPALTYDKLKQDIDNAIKIKGNQIHKI